LRTPERLTACGVGIAIVTVALSQMHAQQPKFDPAAVESGQRRFIESCGFCHGANARGGEGGPDLLRSVVVLEDDAGKRLGPFLKEGRPDQGMPRFERFSAGQVAELATFLHSRVAAAARRGDIRLDAATFGDSAAGAAFFRGEGACSTCHSATGDLKGIGAKYDLETLQGRVLMPRRSAAVGTAPTAVIRFASGQSYSGVLRRLTDFDVSIDEPSGARRSFLRNGAEPTIEVRDPLQSHIDMWPKLTDDQMHNLVAFLASLK
jgi:cytochrome c oxidase cbb3-type subunit III